MLPNTIRGLDEDEGVDATSSSRELVCSPTAWEDDIHCQTHDAKLLEKLNGLIEECLRHPFKGTGKPEPLGGNLSGWWSRRIGWEQRLVYRVSGQGDGQALEVAQCRYHY